MGLDSHLYVIPKENNGIAFDEEELELTPGTVEIVHWYTHEMIVHMIRVTAYYPGSIDGELTRDQIC